MNIEQYVAKLESQVDPSFVEDIKDWPTDTKLYMYLHNIQLVQMREYMAIALKIKDHLTDQEKAFHEYFLAAGYKGSVIWDEV